MVRRQESVTSWFPDCFPDRFDFGDFFFLFSIQGYGKDKPVCQLHCGEHSTFSFILCSVYSEPMAEVEFFSDYSFRIRFLVRGIPDSFTNLQNLIHASACPAAAAMRPKNAGRERNSAGRITVSLPPSQSSASIEKHNFPAPFSASRPNLLEKA